MSQTTLSIRIDAADKKKFEEFCDNVGMNISVAVNMFVKAVLREQRLPFSVESERALSDANIKKIEAALISARTAAKRRSKD